MFEYYRYAFELIGASEQKIISKKYIEDSKNIISKIVNKEFDSEEVFFSDQAFDKLNNILISIENEFKRILEKHSCFYWIHLYRRISPVLPEELAGLNANSQTLAYVRAIAEQAIFKYGKIDNFRDVWLSNELDEKKILGGYFIKSIKKFSEEIKNKDFKKLYIRSLKQQPQWVLGDFSLSIFSNIYIVEALAYYYWRITASMRAAGKGVGISLHENFILEHRSNDHDKLIFLYDQRNDNFLDGFVSNVGTYVKSGEVSDKSILFCAINADRVKIDDFSSIFDNEIEIFDKNTCLNYLPSFVDGKEYYKSHKYLETPFLKKFKFSLKNFCFFAYTASNAIFSKGGANGLLHRMQRAYICNGSTPFSIKNYIKNGINNNLFDSNDYDSNILEHLDLIINFLTLNSSNKKNIGIWSTGPRYFIIPYGENYIYDFSSWPLIFKNLFFGLKNYDKDSQKGKDFEKTFKSYCEDNSVNVINDSKEIYIDGKYREIDLAIRDENKLYICECRSMEMPINNLVGFQKTINKRIKDFEEKIDQVDSLVEFIMRNPKGNNYDYSWAKEIIGIVVSPNVEWIDSFEDKKWISVDKKIPKILSLQETVLFVKTGDIKQ